MTISDCLFEDIRIRSGDCDMILIQAEPRVCSGADGVRYSAAGRLRNCVFRNVSVTDGSSDGKTYGCAVVVKGRSASEDVKDITLDGVSRFGEALTATAPGVAVGPFAENIRFIPEPGGVPFVSEIELLPGEVWWGGGGGDGQSQPYGTKDSRRIDLRRHGDTSSPLLVSSRGRYIWSERPFGYVFKDGKIIFDSDSEKIKPVNAGSTLKDAYLAAVKAHMRFDGRTPPDIFFTLPQWNNWIEIALRGMNQKSVDEYTEELAASSCESEVDMVEARIPAMTRPATIAKRNPFCAISEES
jgi:alpha-glucosidase